MSSDQDRQTAIKTLAELIKESDVGMLTTLKSDGSLHSRPMINAEPEFSGELWFITEAAAPKVDEVQRNEQVNVTFASPKDQHFVSISGAAEIVRDERKLELLWDSKYADWFPKDVDRSQLSLLKVTVETAEYWDASSSRMQQIAGLAKATVGKRQSHSPDHGKIEWPAEKGAAN